MSFRHALALCLLMLACTASVTAGAKPPATPVHLKAVSILPLRVAPASIAAAVACTTVTIDEAIYRMDGWVTGNELYKAYIDPANQCPAPYPFAVTEIGMPMYFATATQLDASVDVEEVQLLNGTCQAPGTMKAISKDYTITIPAAGYYTLWIPLDSPVTVDGPFFAGFFLGSTIDASAGAAILMDSLPVHCRSYNIWDTAVGFVDLTNFPPEFGPDWNFPGDLAMEVSGLPGGSGGTIQPAPEITLLSPTSAANEYGTVTLWAWETSGSNIIDHVSFEYQGGLSWSEIGRDYDGTHTLRDGVHAAEVGNGYSMTWDFSNRPERTYTLRVTAMDSLDRIAATTTSVYLEPTPPVPIITSPANGSDICSPLNVLMQCNDANMQDIQVYRKDASLTYLAGAATLSQQTLGDANGNTADGNHASASEYGDYYCGPAAAAIALKQWYDRGYVGLMKNGVLDMTLPQMAEELAANMDTRKHLGTYDENLFSGLKTYADNHGNEINVDFLRNPTYWQMRIWAEEEERAVILGLGGTPGMWVVLNGFSGWEQTDGTYTVSISNPITGTIQTIAYRTNFDVPQLYVSGSWHNIEIAVSALAKNWSPTRTLIGADTDGSDGWSLNWDPAGLTEDQPCFLRAVGQDSTLLEATSTVLVRYNCSGIFAPGDYNGDTYTDLSDLYRLVNYLTKQGPAPVGGAGRADVNCDNIFNLADIVYYANYLFGQASPPCF